MDDSSYISAIAALLGAAIGGLTSFATTWVSQSYQGRRETVTKEIAKRETLYAEYMNEASRLLIDAIEHDLEQTTSFVTLLSLMARMRLFASDTVLLAADQLRLTIIDFYLRPSMNTQQVRELFRDAHKEDGPLDAFSDACREELQKLARRL